MCLVLKLDNGKVVSITNEQTESCQHPVPYYNIDMEMMCFKFKQNHTINEEFNFFEKGEEGKGPLRRKGALYS